MHVRYETRPDIPVRSFKSKKNIESDDGDKNDMDVSASSSSSTSSLNSSNTNDLPFRKFKNDMKIKITSLDQEKIEFDLCGVDASYANAIRRIMLDEVPSIAIEFVEIETNTSIIQDEVLAHRLGLVPILFDPINFPMYEKGDQLNEKNYVEFVLDVKCHKQGDEIRNGSSKFFLKLRIDKNNNNIIFSQFESTSMVSNWQSTN